MKRILIVEDKKAEAEGIIAVIRKLDPAAEVVCMNNPAEAYEYAFSNPISVFIVDIVLYPKRKNDVSGLNFVERIRKYADYKQTPIVFITSLEDRRLYAYEDLHCYKYLRKPIFYNEVEETMREVLELKDLKAEAPAVKVKNDGVVYVIQQNEIIYAKSSLSKLTIVTDRDCIQVFYMSCNALMQQLNPEIFIQCNRCTIINKSKILSYNTKEDMLLLAGCDTKIKVGRVYKNSIMKEIENG